MEIVDEIYRKLTELKNLPTPVSWWDVFANPSLDNNSTITVQVELEKHDADNKEIRKLQDKIVRLVYELTVSEPNVKRSPYVNFVKSMCYGNKVNRIVPFFEGKLG